MTSVRDAFPPRIAVLGRWSEQVSASRRDCMIVTTDNLRAVLLAGGEPVPFFQESHLSPAERLAGVQGVLLPGGEDVDPALYGEEPHPATAPAPYAGQDAFELGILRAALSLGLPVLAICRGCQLLNVAQGGSLVQHLGDAEPHKDVLHEVLAEPGSLLAEVCGDVIAGCSSFHHQAIARVGAGLTVTGRAPDGTVEALEMPGRNVLAVQWHPEDTAQQDAAQLQPFRWLVARAREFAAG